MTNNEHAARLRDMADQNQLNASVWREQSTSLSPWSGLTHRQCHQEGLRCEREAAALLAGAEALERQERDLDAIKAADAALTEAMETFSDLRGNLEVVRKALALAESMRLAFSDLVAYAERYAPKSPHEGACTPESGCDLICAELSDLGDAVRLGDKMSKQYAAALARLEGK